jgi:hypothetical protein
MRTPPERRTGNYTRNALGAPAKTTLPARPMARTVLSPDSVSVWAWPSRGGLIVLNHATALDFTFLGFDTVQPPLWRDYDQDAEDALCQKLLLLGAKWFDSKDRYTFVAGVADKDDRYLLPLEAGEMPPLTRMERRWVSVAIVAAGKDEGDEDGGKGGERIKGLWVLEYETTLPGMQEKHNLQPCDVDRVSLARTMEEKCEILKAMGARFFASPSLYEGGAACVNAWEEKTQGEVGPLVKTQYGE